MSFQNLPRDALPDGMGEKLSTLKRPKKYKTSENDFSHGSFFLRIGGIGETFQSTVGSEVKGCGSNFPTHLDFCDNLSILRSG